MKKKSKRLGITLMGIGGLMLLGMSGINIGWIIGLIIPAFMTYKGWKWYSKGDKGFIRGLGVLFMASGIIWLTSMLHVIVGLAIAVFLIYQGFTFVRRDRDEAFMESPTVPLTATYSTFDEIDDWEKNLTK